MQQNALTWFVIALVVLAGGYGLYKVTNAPAASDADMSASGTVETGTDSSFNDTPNTPIETGGGAKTYTMADVAAHATKESCWSAVRGNVYDLTLWIGSHPGGERAIIGLCGKDGTSAFEARHGGSERPEETLASFQIGVLAQ